MEFQQHKFAKVSQNISCTTNLRIAYIGTLKPIFSLRGPAKASHWRTPKARVQKTSQICFFNVIFYCIFFLHKYLYFFFCIFFSRKSLRLTHSLIPNVCIFFSGVGKEKIHCFYSLTRFCQKFHKNHLFQGKKKIRNLCPILQIFE